MHQVPKIQILIPAYNVEQYLPLTLDSVIAQTYQNWEIILVDDCSADNTLAIATQYSERDQRIKVLQNESNLGMMPNWNRGLKEITAEYWVKLDADDLLYPEALQEAINILENDPEVGLVCSAFTEINPKGEIQKSTLSTKHDFITDNKFDPVVLVKRGTNGLYASGISQQGIILIRRSILKAAGEYLLARWGDQEFWFRFGAYCKFYYIPETRYYYRKWEGSETSMLSDDGYQLSLYASRKAIFDCYLNLGKITKKEHKKFCSENQFRYNSHLIYKHRIRGEYINMTSRLLNNFLRMPLRTLKDNLHIDRLLPIR